MPSQKKKLLKCASAAVLLLIVVGYPTALWWDIKKVENFCADMKPGLSVAQIPALAARHHVDLRGFREGHLGVKVDRRKDTWFIAVAAPMTIGEHACGVYHNQKVVISARKVP